jgi:mRNA deadenylase 3'-5' endonuclease subunit Ccr4
VIKLLEKHKPDVITLQEVDQFDFFKKRLGALPLQHKAPK